MSVYGDLDELKATLQVNDDFLDEDIERELETASRDVDDATGQRFFTNGEEERLFHAGCYDWSVRIGPIVTLESLHVDSACDGTFATEWVLDTDFILEPWNAAVDGKPYRHAALTRRGGRSFPDVRPNVKVVGVFGWEAVPSKIKTATILLANRYLKRTREAPFAMLPGETTAMRIARIDPDVHELLRHFTDPPRFA